MSKIEVKAIDSKSIELFAKFLNLRGESFIKKARKGKTGNNKKQTVLRTRFQYPRQATTLDNRLESKKSPKCTQSSTGQTLP